MTRSSAIERVSSDDLMSLATDRGTVPLQLGAVLLLDTAAGYEPDALIATIESRLPAIPRLRQVLIRPGFPYGRPFWTDDANFRIARHVSTIVCPAGEGRTGLLAMAADVLMRPLARSRPLWAMRIVTDVADGRTGVVLVLHHVLADGLGALSILAGLTGTSPVPEDRRFPQRAPARTRLACDSVRRQLRAIGRIPRAVQRFARGLSELRPAIGIRASPSSLNRAIGAIGIQLVIVRADLSRLVAAAHARHATVNDVVLAAITSALACLLAQRGEAASEFVISVPFSSRTSSASDSLGNQSGAVPLLLPAVGEPAQRLTTIARITAAAKAAPRGASTAFLGPMFRGLAHLGLYQRFIDRQALVHTFVTNLRGPLLPVRLGGLPITEVIPLTTAMGNITVSFAMLSYAGTLTVTVVADRTTCPDVVVLGAALEDELEKLCNLI